MAIYPTKDPTTKVRGAKASAGNNIGELLLKEGLISEPQLEAALQQQRLSHLPLMRILVESQAIDETKRLNFFKQQFGVPHISLAGVRIDPLLTAYIEPSVCRKQHLLPVRLDSDGLIVAMEDPSDLLLLDHLKEAAGVRIKPVITHSAELAAAMEQLPVERTPLPQTVTRATRFDAVVRSCGFLWLPVMSMLALGAIFGLLWYVPAAQAWLRENIFNSTATRATQYTTLFVYFFLTWGVWTIIMYELQGVCFQDLQWKEIEDFSERKRSKALLLSLLLGWAGVDRFYLGYKRVAALKLLTLGMLGTWWAVDAFLIFTNQIPDAAGRRL